MLGLITPTSGAVLYNGNASCTRCAATSAASSCATCR